MANTLQPREVPRGQNYGFVDPSDIFRSDLERMLLQQELTRRQQEEEEMAREEAKREQSRLDLDAKRMAEDIALRKEAGEREKTKLGFERAQAAEQSRMPGAVTPEAYEAVKPFPELAGDITVTPGGEQTMEGPLTAEQEAEALPNLGVYQTPEQITSAGGSEFRAERQKAADREAISERTLAARAAENEKNREVQRERNEMSAALAQGRLDIQRMSTQSMLALRDLQQQKIVSDLQTAQDKRDTVETDRLRRRAESLAQADQMTQAIDDLITVDKDGKARLTPDAAWLGGGSGNIAGVLAPRAGGAMGGKALQSLELLKGKLTTEAMALMKAQSRTGATGFGQLTEKELGLIQSTLGRLNLTGMSEEQGAAELLRIRNQIAKAYLDAPTVRTTTPSTPAGAGAAPGGTPTRRSRRWNPATGRPE